MHWMLSVKPSPLLDKREIATLLLLMLMILLLPLRWLCASVIAALFHEMGHYIAVYLLGGTVHNLKIGPSGAMMSASGLSRTSEVICLLAGPLAGLIPMLVIRRFPSIALCGLIQSAYNLLPVYPLDGGKILKQMIKLIGGNEQWYHIIERTVIVLLILLCIYVYFRFRLSLFYFLTILLLRKTPCKQRRD